MWLEFFVLCRFLIWVGFDLVGKNLWRSLWSQILSKLIDLGQKGQNYSKSRLNIQNAEKFSIAKTSV